jgi:hypothetical protein
MPTSTLGAAAVRHQQVMGRGEGRLGLDSARRVRPDPVAVVGDDVGLVHGRDVLDAVAEARRHDRCVFDERLDDRALGPPAGVLERLGEIPVVERRVRLDPVREQLVDEPVVEVEAGLVDPARSLREHARPGDREAIGVEPELGHEGHVLAVAVVVVARHVAVLAVRHPAGRVREAVPDARALAVLAARALDLVGGGRRAPHEALREHRAHPFTAPSMIPPTICLPSRAKTISTGTVPTRVPARMIERSGT